MANPVRVYPTVGTYLADIPHASFVAATKGLAEDLEATGAFTLNPNAANRDGDAVDLGDEPQEFSIAPHYLGRPAPQPEAPAEQPAPTQPEE